LRHRGVGNDSLHNGHLDEGLQFCRGCDTFGRRNWRKNDRENGVLKLIVDLNAVDFRVQLHLIWRSFHLHPEAGIEESSNAPLRCVLLHHHVVEVEFNHATAVYQIFVAFVAHEKLALMLLIAFFDELSHFNLQLLVAFAFFLFPNDICAGKQEIVIDSTHQRTKSLT
jgi:hypothetical protein